MTLSTTSTNFRFIQRASRSGTALFNNLGIYRFCIAVIVIDFLDIMDFLDYATGNELVKYFYAAVVLGLMAVYFLRWKRVDTTTIAPIIYFVFFLAMAFVFTVNFFIYDVRDSYISAFIAPLVFSLSIFIPANSITLDAGKIIRNLTLLLSIGIAFYLVEAVVKPLDFVSNITSLREVQVHKSIIFVLALCLSILTGRGILTIFLAVATIIALVLRPMSTLVLALICCLPIAIALRRRVSYPRPVAVLVGFTIAMTTLFLAVIIPLLLYFFFDDISALIESSESYLKSDLMGAQSNMAFRLAILKFAFTEIDNTSFWYGSALSGSHTILLALIPGWDWWWYAKGTGEATIHSDFVVILVLSGILGYIVFSVAFFLVLKNRFRELFRPDLRGNAVVLQSISIVGLIALIVYCSDEPWLSYYDHANVVWMLLLISEVARKSKVIDSTEQGRKAIIPGAFNPNLLRH